MTPCEKHPEAALSRMSGGLWRCEECLQVIPQRSCCRMCGTSEDVYVVNIALKGVPICDGCALTITRQTVATLTVDMLKQGEK